MDRYDLMSYANMAEEGSLGYEEWAALFCMDISREIPSEMVDDVLEKMFTAMKPPLAWRLQGGKKSTVTLIKESVEKRVGRDRSLSLIDTYLDLMVSVLVKKSLRGINIDFYKCLIDFSVWMGRLSVIKVEFYGGLSYTIYTSEFKNKYKEEFEKGLTDENRKIGEKFLKKISI